jgi:amidase
VERRPRRPPRRPAGHRGPRRPPKALEARGWQIEDAEPDFSGADECFEVLRGVTFAGAFKAIAHDLKPALAENVRFGLALTPERIAKALELRGALFARMREFLTRYDALAAPVTQVPPFAVELEYPTEIAGTPMGSYLEWFRSCSRVTVTSHPAVAVPAGFTADGLPIGLQLVGRHQAEAALLQLADAASAPLTTPQL